MGFYDNFVLLCAKNNLTPSGAAGKVGMSNAAANGWKKGKYPSDVTLQKLANLFGVSVEELVADNEQKKERPPLIPKDEREEKFLSLFRRMSPEQQAREIAYLETQATNSAGEDSKFVAPH